MYQKLYQASLKAIKKAHEYWTLTNKWWVLRESNPWPSVRQTDALPAELNTHNNYDWCRQEDLNPQPTDYDSVALPVELCRQWIGLFIITNLSTFCNTFFIYFFLFFHPLLSYLWKTFFFSHLGKSIHCFLKK